MTTVLLLGFGGREHALGRALAASAETLHVAPGNPGLAGLGTLHDIDACDPEAVVALARQAGADLVVVGPEAPLVAGSRMRYARLGSTASVRPPRPPGWRGRRPSPRT